MKGGRSFVIFLVSAVFVGVVVFLWQSDFFAAWDGRVVAREAIGDRATVRVLIVTEGERRSAFIRRWDPDVVRGLDVPEDPLLLPPLSDAIIAGPGTRKDRFALHQLLEGPVVEGETDRWAVVATTAPRSLGLAGLFVLLLVAVRNMIVAGAPWAITPREALLPKALGATGQVTASGPGPRPQKGPPPGSRNTRTRRH